MRRFLIFDWIKKTQIRLKFLKFVQDPTQSDRIFEMIDLAASLKSNQEVVVQMEERLLANNPGFKKMWEQRWLPTIPQKSSLAKLPPESLGQAYLKHLESNNLQIAFFPEIKTDRVIDYLSRRMYHAHDLWHSLLGYDISPGGELEVQGFGVGQIGSPIATLLIAGGLLNLVDQQPESTPEVFDRMTKAYQRGKSAKFLLDFPIEEMLDQPLVEVQSLLEL